MSVADDATKEPDDQAPGQTGGQTGGQPDAPGVMREFSEEEVAQIEQERKERLDPDNRPPNAEVDNTDREFDVEHGRFTDSEPPEGGDLEFDPSAE
ncbi:MAG TPA: hypothetical protein VFM09_14745 [Marmoricola sp.]|nr:hypothetical protein [Marmoricola sp.]